jgi:hypothetical protein
VVRKSTIPEWAVARAKLSIESGDSEMQALLFISYVLASESPVEYGDLNQMERNAADRLLRMGVLLEAKGSDRRLELAKPWRRAFESRWKKDKKASRTKKKNTHKTKAL